MLADIDTDGPSMHGSERTYFYKEHPKSCAPEDFWAQVKRTVNGKPVGEEQIRLIVAAILEGLQIRETDTLLDLCCGNGALTDRIFAQCQGGLGVDYSEPLIDVAKRHFESHARQYVLDDAESFVRSVSETGGYTKVLCYGAFQYLTAKNARSLLENLQRRFTNVERVFIGNLPDKSRMDEFFKGRAEAPAVADDPGSPIGIWRTEAEFSDLAGSCGWNVEFRRMTKDFYAAAYRFDALLTPNKRA